MPRRRTPTWAAGSAAPRHSERLLASARRPPRCSPVPRPCASSRLRRPTAHSARFSPSAYCRRLCRRPVTQHWVSASTISNIRVEAHVSTYGQRELGDEATRVWSTPADSEGVRPFQCSQFVFVTCAVGVACLHSAAQQRCGSNLVARSIGRKTDPERRVRPLRLLVLPRRASTSNGGTGR